jgi:hypothetical protein
MRDNIASEKDIFPSMLHKANVDHTCCVLQAEQPPEPKPCATYWQITNQDSLEAERNEEPLIQIQPRVIILSPSFSQRLCKLINRSVSRYSTGI